MNAIQSAFARVGYDVKEQTSANWSSSVTYRTYQELLKQGIPANPYEQQKMSKPAVKN